MPREPASVELRITQWGAFARRFAGRHSNAHVVARFERSLHIAAGGDVICVVAPELGNGPLNAVLDAGSAQQLARRAIREGASVGFDRASARMGHACTIITGNAASWLPPAPTLHPDRIFAMPGMIARLAVLADKAAGNDGLARLALGLDVPDTALARVARPRLARLAGWLAHASSISDNPPPTDLIGLGPGLTPSGDDVLCGVLIALAGLQRHHELHEINLRIAAAAPALTSPLSRAFLAAAADGQAAASLHRAVNAMLDGDAAALPGCIAEASRIGHTSGWDALAGAAMALKSSA